jgi:hypothetical protein
LTFLDALKRTGSVSCLPALRTSAGVEASRHCHDEALDEPGGDAPPALFHSVTKAIPLFLCFAVIVVLRVEFVHALLVHPPEVLNWIQIG